LITDRKTGKCRGFGFVTVKTDEEADQFIEKFNGAMVKETTLKIEKALPRTKEKGEGEEGSAPAPAPRAAVDAPISKRAKGGKGSGGGGNNNRRSNNTTTSSGDSDSFQPDPRWASVLEQLKEQLAAQTTGS
jgi:RNA recognition motif-containing protein